MIRHGLGMGPALLAGLALLTSMGGAEEPLVLKDPKAKTSYAVGVDLGNNLKKGLVELDADAVSLGVRDALAGNKTLLTEEEIKLALSVLRTDIRAKEAEAMKGLAERNRREGEAFVAENKTREGVVSLPSGLQYRILKAGAGKTPKVDDTVACHYRGTFIDGREFDSSYKRGGPATFVVNRAIKGWTEALQLMTVGSKWQLFVPPSLAYGERAAQNGIGPNSTLIFEVELLSIKDKS